MDLLNNEYHLSVINKIEMLGYPDLDENEEARFNLFIDHSFMHQVDNRVIEKTIDIRKKHKIKLPDALIAATCLVNGLDILTLNKKDFDQIEGLKIIEPESF